MATANDTAPAGASAPEDHINAASARIATAADLVETVQRALSEEEGRCPEYGTLSHAVELLRDSVTELDLAGIGQTTLAARAVPEAAEALKQLQHGLALAVAAFVALDGANKGKTRGGDGLTTLRDGLRVLAKARDTLAVRSATAGATGLRVIPGGAA